MPLLNVQNQPIPERSLSTASNTQDDEEDETWEMIEETENNKTQVNQEAWQQDDEEVIDEEVILLALLREGDEKQKQEQNGDDDDDDDEAARENLESQTPPLSPLPSASSSSPISKSNLHASSTSSTSQPAIQQQQEPDDVEEAVQTTEPDQSTSNQNLHVPVPPSTPFEPKFSLNLTSDLKVNPIVGGFVLLLIFTRSFKVLGFVLVFGCIPKVQEFWETSGRDNLRGCIRAAREKVGNFSISSSKMVQQKWESVCDEVIRLRRKITPTTIESETKESQEKPPHPKEPEQEVSWILKKLQRIAGDTKNNFLHFSNVSQIIFNDFRFQVSRNLQWFRRFRRGLEVNNKSSRQRLYKIYKICEICLVVGVFIILMLILLIPSSTARKTPSSESQNYQNRQNQLKKNRNQEVENGDVLFVASLRDALYDLSDSASKTMTEIHQKISFWNQDPRKEKVSVEHFDRKVQTFERRIDSLESKIDLILLNQQQQLKLLINLNVEKEANAIDEDQHNNTKTSNSSRKSKKSSSVFDATNFFNETDDDPENKMMKSRWDSVNNDLEMTKKNRKELLAKMYSMRAEKDEKEKREKAKQDAKERRGQKQNDGDEDDDDSLGGNGNYMDRSKNHPIIDTALGFIENVICGIEQIYQGTISLFQDTCQKLL